MDTIAEYKKLKDKMRSNMFRHEKLLILPYNTTRFIDIVVQLELNMLITGAKSKPDLFKKTMMQLCNRAEIDMGKYNNLPPESVNELIDNGMAKFYSLAPRTILGKMCYINSKQSFIDKVTILTKDKRLTDDTFEVDFYDGTLDALEEYFNKNNYTCLVIDSIEKLWNIVSRGNIDFNHKTVYLSKLGYNFMKDENGKVKLKYFDEIMDKYPQLELLEIRLFDFSKPDISAT